MNVRPKKPRNSWKIVFFTAGGPLPERKFTSENKTYEAVNTERELVREGISRATRAVVYTWDLSGGRWMPFERHDLVKEAKEIPLRPVGDEEEVLEKDGGS